MRIAGGILRGRVIEVPRQGVRPTQDQVRQALFSMLGVRTVSARFLDLFAGSGAVGVEAWSRGAAEVEFVEVSRRVLPVLRANVAGLCPQRTRVVGADAFVYLKKYVADRAFDIIFCDPPYGGSDEGGLDAGKLVALAGGCLADSGVLVFERSVRSPPVEGAGLRLLDERRYGETALQFFRRESGDGAGGEGAGGGP